MIAGWGPQDRSGLTPIDGGVTAAGGFAAGGVVSGVKASGRPDLAMVRSDARAQVAVMTTRNHVRAPSCDICVEHASDGAAQVVVINSGNANVCTPDGRLHADRMAAAAAEAADVSQTDVLVMSTGVIGVPLPVEKIEAAMPAVVADLTDDGSDRAARAMMTTDTTVKQVAYEVTDDQGTQCVVGGMAKGVGMIEPSMATMLAVITTDAAATADELDAALRAAVDETFNRISVDGDQSTSDTVAVLANGTRPAPVEADALTRAIHAVCADLAWMIVADGEGASRVAGITVSGAADDVAAERLARAVATSLLVRAAIHGADPNWGRILMALGNADVAFALDDVSVSCAGTTVCRAGVAVPFDRAAVAEAMMADAVSIDISVGSGDGVATVLTCDLTPEYVRFNAEYTT